jgi:hypothetical protein
MGILNRPLKVRFHKTTPSEMDKLDFICSLTNRQKLKKQHLALKKAIFLLVYFWLITLQTNML